MKKNNNSIEKNSDWLINFFYKGIKYIKTHQKIVLFIGIFISLFMIILGIVAYIFQLENDKLNNLYYHSMINSRKNFEKIRNDAIQGLEIPENDLINFVKSYKKIINESKSGSISNLAQYNLGLIYYSVKNYDSASPFFKKASEDKNFPLAHQALLNLGHCFINLAYQEKNKKKALDKLKTAHKIYEQVEKRFSESPSMFLALRYKALANELLAEKYIQLKNIKKALLFYKKSHKNYKIYRKFIKKNSIQFNFNDPYLIYATRQPLEYINIANRRVSIAIEYLTNGKLPFVPKINKTIKKESSFPIEKILNKKFFHK